MRVLYFGFLLLLIAAIGGAVYSGMSMRGANAPAISTRCASQGPYLAPPQGYIDEMNVERISRFLRENGSIFNFKHIENVCLSKINSEEDKYFWCYLVELQGKDPLNRASWEICFLPNGEFYQLKASE